MMKRNELIVVIATLGLVLYTLTLSVLGQGLSPLQKTRTISNAGTVKAIGVGVYSDNECTKPLPSIDWGILEPGSSKNVTCYIRNEGNLPSTLSMYTENWDPLNASEYVILTWDYGGQPLNIGEVTQVTFTLSILDTIQGITSFKFDIVIVGSG